MNETHCCLCRHEPTCIPIWNTRRCRAFEPKPPKPRTWWRRLVDAIRRWAKEGDEP